MKKSVKILSGIIITIMIVIFGVFLVKNLGKEKIGEKTVEKLGILKQSLGSLCSGEEECKEFCLNNRGLCEEYCKGRYEELCLIIFPPDQENFQDQLEVDEEEPISDEKPVLKNLGINIDRWNKQTNLAGDIIFDKRLANSEFYNYRPLLEFSSDVATANGRQITPETWFFVPLGTEVVAMGDGFVYVYHINHTNDFGIAISKDWYYERGMVPKGTLWGFGSEHLVNLRVRTGDRVKAGDVLGEAGPRNSFNNELGFVEIAVGKVSESGDAKDNINYCPYDFLEDSLKPIYKEKLEKLASDWEEFAGKDVYKQESWVAPGCLAKERKGG